MPIDVVSHGTVGYGNSAMSLGLPPNWQPGDIFVMVIALAPYNNPVAGGWESIAATGLVRVLWRRAIAGEAAPYVTGTGPMIGRITAYRGCLQTGNPFDTGVNGVVDSNGPDMVIPDGSGNSVADSLILYAIGADNMSVEDPTYLYSYTNTDLSFLSLQYLGSSPVTGIGRFKLSEDGNYFGYYIIPYCVALITGKRAGTGGFANLVANKSSIGDFTGISLALLPAITGGGGGSSSSSAGSVSTPSYSSSLESFSSSASASSSDGEVLSEVLRVDSWEFDSPEPLVANRNPVDYFIASQWMNNGLENQDKIIEAITITSKVSGNGKVEIFAVEEGEAVDTDRLENGVDAEYSLNITPTSKVVTHPRKKGGPKNMRLWAVKFSGTWDGTNERDRLDKIIVEVNAHGTKK